MQNFIGVAGQKDEKNEESGFSAVVSSHLPCEPFYISSYIIFTARKAIIAAAEASPAASLARQKKINPTALKVKLMKLKMKARGDKGLPEHERVYLEIRLPDGQQKPYFFSKVTWISFFS